jgi:photosystem II stability/assembly factor-like uncharacterized protein
MIPLKKLRAILINSSILVWLLLPFLNTESSGQSVISEPYTWKNVQIVGGGFVSGIVFHPKEPGLRYCRTDIGGAYRWNEDSNRWEPLLDWVSYDDYNLMGVESIALDPSDPDRVYLACGTYTLPWVPDGAVLCSDDRGKTFLRTDVPFKFGANENGRGNGERMAVDPNNGNIIYLGTRLNGLWRSTDRGVKWSAVKNFPNVSENPPDSIKEERELQRWYWQHKGSGIIRVVFDPRSAVSGKGSRVIYVAVSLMNRENLFYSSDFGNSWKPVAGQPTDFRPTHAVLAPDGILYITYGDNPGPGRMKNGAVWKYDTNNDIWTDITPDKPDPAKNRSFGYAAVAVDYQHPDVLIVSTYHRYEVDKGEEIFRSTDGGKTWKAILHTCSRYDYSAAPYIKKTGVHWLFDIEIDPFNPDHALFTTGYGGHETFNLTAADRDDTITWYIMSTGIEETVALDLLSPSKGAQLTTGIGDYGGFIHWYLDVPAPDGNFENPRFSNTDGLACAENNPDLIVRVGNESHPSNQPANIGYSTDGGRSWQPCESMPDKESRHGSIAVSADGESWIWTPQNSVPFVTHDQGKTWTQSKNLPEKTRVMADRVQPSDFYAMNLYKGKFYISHDSGSSFEEKTLDLHHEALSVLEYRGDNRGGQDRLYATPGNRGDIWLPAFDGLYHSSNAGTTFEKIEDITNVYGFGFGKEAPGTTYPALYLIGVIQGTYGFFRSDDSTMHWVRINDDQHQYGLVFHITGDPKKYGRVYVGTHGRGTLYGNPKIAMQ